MKKHLLVLTLLLAACSNPDYVTRHDVSVYLGQENRPTIKQVEAWTQSTINFWKEKFPCLYGCLTPGTDVFFEDTQELFIHYQGELIQVLGASNGGTIWIGNFPDYLDSLFAHEYSHTIFFACFPSIPGPEHHDYFGELGFNEREVVNEY